MNPDETTRFMRRALELARRGWGRVAPNPMVGAVVVRDGQVLGEGWHREYGGPHAEVEALRAAGDRARGATVYVSLEPCSHHGKTPPCTDALMAAGVARVVYGASDPDPRASGGGEVLRRAGIEVVGDVLPGPVHDLNAAFFHGHDAAERPFVALKLAMSLDGRIADRAGRSGWITGEPARAEVHRLRAGFDAIAVGIGTAMADDPLLTARGAVPPRVPPTRVVFDRHLELSPESRLVASVDQAPLLVLAANEADPTRARTLTQRGVRVLRANGLEWELRALRDAGVRSMFVEGGAGLAGTLLNGHAVDWMYLFYAPLLLGSGLAGLTGLAPVGIDQATRWRRVATQVFGSDTLITLAAR